MAEETKSKLSSRKFVVWLVWLIITILLIAFCVVVAIVTQNMQSNAISLLETIIGYFFAISMMYLGMNVGQKVGLSFSQKSVDKSYNAEVKTTDASEAGK